MADSKGPRDSTAGPTTNAPGGRGTSGFNPWNPDGRPTHSLLGRLKQTWTDGREPATAAGGGFGTPSPGKPRGYDPAVMRQVKEAFWAKFTELGKQVDEQIHNERAYYSSKISEAIAEVLSENRLKLPDEVIAKIREDILEGVIGFGPLQKLLDDPDVTEVMVNGPKKVFVEKKGKLYLSDITFTDEDQLRQVIEKIVIPIGRRVDESQPMTDARLPDGSRVNIVIRPLALSGSTITIRKFHKTPLKLESLTRAGTLSREMAVFLEGCVRSKLNIIVSGETGSGKTTTLNALSGFLPHDSRIVTIEDSAELQLQQDHVVSLESRQANLEGRGEVTIRDLLRNALHMIPDRIVVGECRGGEALDMLNAMSSGNDGSMTTGHANTAYDMIGRLETMVMMAGMRLPSRAIREQIASAIQIIVQQSRGKDGIRRITSISELAGMKEDQVVLQEIFRFDSEGIEEGTGVTVGHHTATGVLPICLQRLLRDDFFIPDGTFGPSVDIQQIREEMHAREEDEKAREDAARKAKIVMQQALARPEEEEEQAASLGSVFTWRQALAGGSDVADQPKGAALSHRDRLRELTRQMADHRKSLLARSVGKDDEDLKLVEELKVLIFEKLPSSGSFEELEKVYATVEDERRVFTTRVDRALTEILREENIELSPQVRKRIIDEVLNDIVGLGPLQQLLDDEAVTEIMVNGPDRVFAERNGKVELTQVKFKEEAHLRHIISGILRLIGRRVDETSPMVDARLRDGSRVNIVIPPISLVGSVLTIRKFAKDPFSIDDLVGFGTMTPEVAAFLMACIKVRINMVISGSTGSGKTTTLNAISSFIGDEYRIVTVEDSAELQLQQDHVLPLEARQSNIEGKGAISIRQLVMNALHMRPDRIIVGECRGGEALDMLIAMNTGHDGSLTTLHSNSPYDTVLRLQTLVMLAGMNLPLRAINEQIAGALQLIVHQDRLPDGTRRITHITELAGLKDEKLQLVDIYRWVPKGIGPKEAHLGALEASGRLPTFINRFVEENAELPQGIFGPSVDIDEVFTSIQAEARKRAAEDRKQLIKMHKAEEAKAEAEIRAANAALAPGELEAASPDTVAPPAHDFRRSASAFSKVFTWKDAMRSDEKGDEKVPTVHNERRWQLFRRMRSLTPTKTARSQEYEVFERARAILTEAVSQELENVAIPDDFTAVDSERVFMATLVAQVLQKVRSEEGMLVERSQEEALQARVLAEFCGYGPIQQLMDDPDISEIMVNGPKKIYVERKGRVVLSDVEFEDDSHVVQILQRMLTPVNRRCDIMSPMVDARLPDGSRVNAVIAPLAISGSTITIRKFAHDPFTIDMLVEKHSLSPDMAAFVKAAVQVRLNIVVSGGTGSGKTTTLNAISAFIPENDRIISIEDTAELQLQQDHVVSLESRPPNLEGTGAISIRDLVKNALHMRPERIVVGECRGGEALDMLQAMATGQSGSLTTAHANTPLEMIQRLEVMVMMAGTGLSMSSIRDQISGTVDLVVQQSRFKDGSRKVTHISEITGISQTGEVECQDIFRFVGEGQTEDGRILGQFQATGYIPKCIRMFRAGNFILPDTIFGAENSVEREYDRIDRQRQIEQQTEKNLEKMRFRAEGGGRPVIRLPRPDSKSSVAEELSRRRTAKSTVTHLLRDGDTDRPPLPPMSESGLGEEHQLAADMRQKMAQNEAEAAEKPVPQSNNMARLDQTDVSSPDEAQQRPEDIKAKFRTRKEEPALLRRLKTGRRDLPEDD